MQKLQKCGTITQYMIKYNRILYLKKPYKGLHWNQHWNLGIVLILILMILNPALAQTKWWSDLEKEIKRKKWQWKKKKQFEHHKYRYLYSVFFCVLLSVSVSLSHPHLHCLLPTDSSMFLSVTECNWFCQGQSIAPRQDSHAGDRGCITLKLCSAYRNNTECLCV